MFLSIGFTLPLQLLFLWILYVEQSLSKNCSASWFGKNCDRYCFCLIGKGCSDDGMCDKSLCKDHFFGPGCAYKSSVHFSTGDSVPKWLKDNNHATCNPDPGSTLITIKYNYRYVVSWIRMHSKYGRHLNDFSIHFNGNESCMNEKRFISDFFVDISCDNLDTIKNCFITGAIVPYLCEVYTSLGAELILKQAANQSSTRNNNETYSAGKAIDHNDDTCSETSGSDSVTYWYLKLQTPITIAYIRIIYKNDIEQSFTYFAYEQNGNTAYKMSDTADDSIAYASEYLPSNHKYFASAIQFFSNKKGPLIICGLEILGDPVCQDGTWGISCENKCNCTPDNACHFATGICTAGCDKGRHGLNCAYNCSSMCLNGVCGFKHGGCLACFPGSYGDYCEKPCENGFYGEKCKNSCSPFCINVCDKVNGSCVCSDNFRGHNCEECKAGWFGAGCNITCPGYCSAEGCMKSEGKCFSCKNPQYKDDLCGTGTGTDVEESSLMSYVLIILCIFLLALVALGVISKSKGNAVSGEVAKVL